MRIELLAQVWWINPIYFKYFISCSLKHTKTSTFLRDPSLLVNDPYQILQDYIIVFKIICIINKANEIEHCEPSKLITVWIKSYGLVRKEINCKKLD